MQLTEFLLKFYSHVEKSGILKNRLAASMFDSAYFAYKKFYEDPFYGLLKKYPTLSGHGHILDIGANIGYTAILFSQYLTDNKKVHAFEPEEKNFEKLKKKIESATLNEKIQAIQAIVGDQDGELELWLNDDHPADHRVATDALKAERATSDKITSVRSVRIDTYAKKHNIVDDISFVKVDVQGYETQVLKGMQCVLQRNHDVILALEYSPREMSALGFDSEEILDILDSHGFRSYQIENGQKLVNLNLGALSTVSDQRGYCDLVFCRNTLL